MQLIIGNKRYSSWSLRPWLLMRHFDLPFDEIMVNLYQGDTRAERLAYSPTGKVPVLVDLWAPWCGPCRTMAPGLEQVAANLAGKLKVVKVNVDEAPRTAARFDARSIPTLVLLQGGKKVATRVGAAPADQLEAWVRAETRR